MVRWLMSFSLLVLVWVYCGTAAEEVQDEDDISDSVDEAMDDIRWMLEGHRLVRVEGGGNRFLECSSGEVGLLDSLKRTGPVTLVTSVSNSSVVLRAQFGFSSLYVYFSRCSYFGSHFPQPLNVTIGENSFAVQVTMTRTSEEGGCKAHLDRVDVVKLSGLSVTTKRGFSYLMEDAVIRWTIEFFRRRISDALVSTALRVINSAALDKDVCSPFKPF